jgi:hypothetical protein
VGFLLLQDHVDFAHHRGNADYQNMVYAHLLLLTELLLQTPLLIEQLLWSLGQ